MSAAQTDGPPDQRDTAHWRAAPLRERTGFLIRRLHQIHTALFAQETAPERVTPIMYSVLSALDQLGAVDQTTLAKAVAIDKTNMADILERLRKRGLVGRRVAPRDRRVRFASLTAAGRALLDRLDDKAERAHARTIEALDAEEQRVFLALMTRIIAANEAVGDGPHPGQDGAKPALGPGIT